MEFFQLEMMSLGRFKPCPQRPKMAKPTSIENWQYFEYFDLNISVLLALRIINEVPINRSQLDVICVQKAKRNTKY